MLFSLLFLVDIDELTFREINNQRAKDVSILEKTFLEMFLELRVELNQTKPLKSACGHVTASHDLS